MSFVLLGVEGGVRPPIAPGTSPPNPDLIIVRSVTVTSGAGTISLSDAAPFLVLSATGLDGPDSELEEDDVRGIDGTTVRGADEDNAGLRFGAARPTFTISVETPTPAETAAAVRNLRQVLSPRRWGPVTLTMTRIDGSVRTLEVRHEYKAEDFAMPRHGGRLWRITLRLHAAQPWWTGASRVIGPWTIPTSGGGVLPFMVPLVTAGASTVLGTAVDIPIGGDEFGWPVVTISGPIAAPPRRVKFSRGDGVGWTMVLPTALSASEQVIVRHDPRALFGGPQITGPDGSSWDSALADGSELFPLRPGVESLLYTVEGAGPGTSMIVSVPELYWSGVQ